MFIAMILWGTSVGLYIANKGLESKLNKIRKEKM
jgi:hypothetical protein